MSPRLPSWIRSSRGSPDAWYFLAMDTTRRRFDCTNVCWALSPWRVVRRSSRFFAGVRPLGAAASWASASRPASMAWASRTSSSLVNNGYWPMSVRYNRTRSSSSRSRRSLANFTGSFVFPTEVEDGQPSGCPTVATGGQCIGSGAFGRNDCCFRSLPGASSPSVGFGHRRWSVPWYGARNRHQPRGGAGPHHHRLEALEELVDGGHVVRSADQALHHSLPRVP